MTKKNRSAIRGLSRLITESSQSFFSSFLDDTKDKKKYEQQYKELLKKLQLAAAQKSLVVLQIKENNSSKFKTISGWIVSNISSDNFMLRMQDDPQKIQMITINDIKKISMLSRSEKRQIK